MPSFGAGADAAFARGNALLAQGNLQGALQSYAVAARADRDNQQYRQRFMLVRQALSLQKQLGVEKDAQRWRQMAQALRSFYASQDLHTQALAVDGQIHKRLQTSGSALQLAQTQLALAKNAEAAATLGDLGRKKATPATEALRAVALARQGEIDQAIDIAMEADAPPDADPGTFYCLARMHAVIGNNDQAVALLTSCFEAVAPSRLDALKLHARGCADFGELASTSGFAEAMQTQSKVAESECSGGSSCAGCPMRAKCSKNGDK
jgi:tetratricopeptide (TPR) repeat protein